MFKLVVIEGVVCSEQAEKRGVLETQTARVVTV